MLKQIAVNRDVGNGRHGEVIDVAEFLAGDEYGSAANALVQMVRKSPLYRDALERMKNAKSDHRRAS